MRHPHFLLVFVCFFYFFAILLVVIVLSIFGAFFNALNHSFFVYICIKEILEVDFTRQRLKQWLNTRRIFSICVFSFGILPPESVMQKERDCHADENEYIFSSDFFTPTIGKEPFYFFAIYF